MVRKSGWRLDIRTHQRDEARTWARRYKKLYEYAEGYRHGWQVQSEIEEELRKQAEQKRDDDYEAYRVLYYAFVAAEPVSYTHLTLPTILLV